MEAQLSAHFARRRPSVIRLAQIEFAKRTDTVEAINVAIGNVSLPMHPAMQARTKVAVRMCLLMFFLSAVGASNAWYRA